MASGAEETVKVVGEGGEESSDLLPPLTNNNNNDTDSSLKTNDNNLNFYHHDSTSTQAAAAAAAATTTAVTGETVVSTPTPTTLVTNNVQLQHHQAQEIPSLTQPHAHVAPSAPPPPVAVTTTRKSMPTTYIRRSDRTEWCETILNDPMVLERDPEGKWILCKACSQFNKHGSRVLTRKGRPFDTYRWRVHKEEGKKHRAAAACMDMSSLNPGMENTISMSAFYRYPKRQKTNESATTTAGGGDVMIQENENSMSGGVNEASVNLVGVGNEIMNPHQIESASSTIPITGVVPPPPQAQPLSPLHESIVASTTATNNNIDTCNGCMKDPNSRECRQLVEMNLKYYRPQLPEFMCIKTDTGHPRYHSKNCTFTGSSRVRAGPGLKCNACYELFQQKHPNLRKSLSSKLKSIKTAISILIKPVCTEEDVKYAKNFLSTNDQFLTNDGRIVKERLRILVDFYSDILPSSSHASAQEVTTTNTAVAPPAAAAASVSDKNEGTPNISVKEGLSTSTMPQSLDSTNTAAAEEGEEKDQHPIPFTNTPHHQIESYAQHAPHQVNDHSIPEIELNTDDDGISHVHV